MLTLGNCYRLGRWVHYQRVEYWIFQEKGTAKITEERIARLDQIGFEWDPQKAQWEKMFAKLKEVSQTNALMEITSFKISTLNHISWTIIC